MLLPFQLPFLRVIPKSTRRIPFGPSLIRSFHLSTPLCEETTGPNIDTLQLSRQLKKEAGFTKEQSQAAVTLISQAITDGIDQFATNLTKRETLNKMSYQQKVDFAKLKGELQLIDRSEFNSLRNEHERLRGDLEKMRTRFKDEINKSLSSVRLDLNLEKGNLQFEGADRKC
ncbi:unnamed protein product [Ambrosiozyma monospora]|uniref:Unnamed protein product n=1 Tax=Ambrosiozyma monospora TaxID=43982 RepID=A0A9W6YZK3_AMBMO|nr:unnamed protein product [Ambrosiozyma monospora]